MSQSTHTLPDFPIATFTTPGSLTYHYIYTSSSAVSQKATVLILHGFPSIPHDFHHQITHLTSLGHSVLAPYLLGYAPTSTPRDLAAYRLKFMSADIISLLDHLNLLSPIPAIGHDWGAILLSRLEYYHPLRFSKLAYLTIAPSPFGATFDLDQVNAMTKEFQGYEGYGYQKFFVDDRVRASELLVAKHERMDMLMFARDADLWKEYFGKLGGLERWLSLGQRTETIEGATEDLLKKRRETFVPRDEREDVADGFGPGYEGPLMWYFALNTNLNVEDEQNEIGTWESYQTQKNVLLVLSDTDPISIAGVQEDMVKGYAKNPEQQLVVQKLASGHFGMLEKPDELSNTLGHFIAGI